MQISGCHPYGLTRVADRSQAASRESFCLPDDLIGHVISFLEIGSQDRSRCARVARCWAQAVESQAQRDLRELRALVLEFPGVRVGIGIRQPTDRLPQQILWQVLNQILPSLEGEEQIAAISSLLMAVVSRPRSAVLDLVLRQQMRTLLDGRCSLDVRHLAVWRHRGLALLGLKQDGLALQFISGALREDRNLVELAVRQRGCALQHAPASLQADREIVLAAVQQSGLALQFASAALRSDKDLVLVALASDTYALQFAGEELLLDRDVVLCAVSRNGLALQHAAAALKMDKELVLVAVQQCGWALRYAASQLQADPEVVQAAVQQDGSALQFASEGLRADRQIVRAAVRSNPAALPYAAERLQQDPELQLEAAAASEHRRTDGAGFPAPVPVPALELAHDLASDLAHELAHEQPPATEFDI
jgi:hypothetical protein